MRNRIISQMVLWFVNSFVYFGISLNAASLVRATSYSRCRVHDAVTPCTSDDRRQTIPYWLCFCLGQWRSRLSLSVGSFSRL